MRGGWLNVLLFRLVGNAFWAFWDTWECVDGGEFGFSADVGVDVHGQFDVGVSCKNLCGFGIDACSAEVGDERVAEAMKVGKESRLVSVEQEFTLLTLPFFIGVIGFGNPETPCRCEIEFQHFGSAPVGAAGFLRDRKQDFICVPGLSFGQPFLEPFDDFRVQDLHVLSPVFGIHRLYRNSWCWNIAIKTP